MPDKAARLIASAILAGSGLIAVTLAAVGGWYFLLLPAVPVACCFVLFGIVALFRSWS
jgi:hypothetical protein